MNNWKQWNDSHKAKAKEIFVGFKGRDGMKPEHAGNLFESMHGAGSADAFKTLPVHGETGKTFPQDTPRQAGEAMSRGEKVKHINTFENAYNHAGFAMTQKTEGFAALLVQKDWANWRKTHPQQKYSDIAGKQQVAALNIQANLHKDMAQRHLAVARTSAEGSENRKAHSSAANAHLNALAHVNGVLAGDKDPEHYAKMNLAAKNATAQAGQPPKVGQPTARPRQPFGTGGLKLASEVIAALTIKQRLAKAEKELDFEAVTKEASTSGWAAWRAKHSQSSAQKPQYAPGAHPAFHKVTTLTNTSNRDISHTPQEYMEAAHAHGESGTQHLAAARNAFTQGKQELGQLHLKATEHHVMAKRIAEAGARSDPNHRHQDYNIQGNKAVLASQRANTVTHRLAS